MEEVLLALEDVADDIFEMYVPSQISTIEVPVTEQEIHSFYRTYVQKNIPVKIKGCISDWSAFTKWQSDDYLKTKLGETEVTVSITPNGLADAILDSKFTLPHETKMQFKNFLVELNNPKENRVLYLQKQNDSFTSEFSKLMDDIDASPSWSAKIFGTSLEAVNFWMGDGRAITSLHKDPYENIYSVVRGEKKFLLFPPSDRVHLKYKEFPVWTFQEDGTLKPEPDQRVPWIDVDQRNPLSSEVSAKLHPVHVTVCAGETLYLPSYWFHHVSQSHSTIAINYWYDIDYGPAYGVFKTFDEIVRVFEKSNSSRLEMSTNVISSQKN